MKHALFRRDKDDTGRAAQFLKVSAWVGLSLFVYATISPLRYRPTLLISSKLEHLAAFAVLGALFCLAYPRRTPTVLAFIIGDAALLEILQLLTPDRHARLMDAIQKIVGGAAGVVAARCLLHLDRARSWFKVRSMHGTLLAVMPRFSWPMQFFSALRSRRHRLWKRRLPLVKRDASQMQATLRLRRPF